MDTLDIIIVAAAGVGIVAFIALAVVLVMQGRSLKRLEERIGPEVPPGAAPSLARVQAIASQPEIRVHVEGLDSGPAQGGAPAGRQQRPGAGQGADAAAASAAAARAAERRQQKAQPAPQPQPRAESSRGGGRGQQPRGGGSGPDKGGNGALYALIGLVVVAVLLALGWFFFMRGGSSTPTQANSGTTAASSTSTSGGSSSAGTTATTPDTAGPIPDAVPPVANKAAYTVAVLNASGVSGAAANRVAPRVQAAGYTLGVVDNATQQDVTTSEVQYVPGRKEVAWNLAKDLGITAAGPVNALSEGRIGTADVVVVVGKDLSK